uniref:Uncharacterized protein n=1 Tax=Magallana gigas TaxID=29159 RepID=K1Q9D6_MAGGI
MWYYEVLYMNTKAVELGPPRDPKNVQGEFHQYCSGGLVFIHDVTLLPCTHKYPRIRDLPKPTRLGSAPSGGTGPTSAYEGHQYSYIDPSARQGFGSALLRGPTILFSGLLRSSTGGNIAIDDVHFVSGDCYSGFCSVWRNRSYFSIRGTSIFLYRSLGTGRVWHSYSTWPDFQNK